MRKPEVGLTVHFCLVGEAMNVMCLPAIILKVEDPSELGLHAAPGTDHVQLAVIVPDGRRGVFAGTPYSPLSAGDFGGTWHYKSEHEESAESESK